MVTAIQLSVPCLNWDGSLHARAWGLGGQEQQDPWSGTFCQALGGSPAIIHPWKYLLPSSIPHGAQSSRTHLTDQRLWPSGPQTGPSPIMNTVWSMKSLKKYEFIANLENIRDVAYKSRFGDSFKKLNNETVMARSSVVVVTLFRRAMCLPYPQRPTSLPCITCLSPSCTWVCDPCRTLRCHLDLWIWKPSSKSQFLLLQAEGP